MWRVRARRKKKKRSGNWQLLLRQVVSAGAGKGGLSDSDFAALSAGYDPTATSSGAFDLYGDDEDLALYGDDSWNSRSSSDYSRTKSRNRFFDDGSDIGDSGSGLGDTMGGGDDDG